MFLIQKEYNNVILKNWLKNIDRLENVNLYYEIHYSQN
jgi:hypothetical protein